MAIRKPLIGSEPYGRELENMPTITKIPDRMSFNHAALNHLKINTENKRVWLSERGMVTEELNLPRVGWTVTQRYHLKDIDKLLAGIELVQKALSDMGHPATAKGTRKNLPSDSSGMCRLCCKTASNAKLFLVCGSCLAAVKVLGPKARKSKDTKQDPGKKS